MSVIMSTSRVAKKPIPIPSGVEVKIMEQQLSLKGPKGLLISSVHPFVSVEVENQLLLVKSKTDNKTYFRSGTGSKLRRSIAGSMRAKISNMVLGVTKGYERKLLLVGVGYRAQAKGKAMVINIGFSHPVNFTIPEGIVIETPSQTEIIVKGVDKELVGYVASTIRAIRPPELYKGKGIRYANERVIQKETKKK